MKAISMFLAMVALVAAPLINLNTAKADEFEAWDGQNVHINWNGPEPVVTLLSSKTAAISDGVQIQVLGTPSAGWTVYLNEEDESPEVEQINVSSPSSVTGVLRVKGAPSAMGEVIIIFPYLRQGDGAVYTAEMEHWGCEGEGCGTYLAWKRETSSLLADPESAVATAVEPAEVIVPDRQRGPVERDEPAASAEPDPVVAAIRDIGREEPAEAEDVDLDEDPTPAPVARAPKKEPKPKKEKKTDKAASDAAEIERLRAELARVKDEYDAAMWDAANARDELFVARDEVERLTRELEVARVAEASPASPPDRSEALTHAEEELRRLALELAAANGKVRGLQDEVADMTATLGVRNLRIAALEEELRAPPSATMVADTSPASGEEATEATDTDDWDLRIQRLIKMAKDARVTDEPY